MADKITTLDSFIEPTEIEIIWNIEGIKMGDEERIPVTHLIVRKPDENNERGEISGFFGSYMERGFYRVFSVPMENNTITYNSDLLLKDRIRDYSGDSSIKIGKNYYDILSSKGRSELITNFNSYLSLWGHLESRLMGTAKWRHHDNNLGDLVVFGEENDDIMISLLQSKIKFITCRHEQGAAFMADVYGRLSQKPSVCLATLGPGATNLITGIADANLDRAPVVAITGQGGLERTYKESHQYIDVVQTLKYVTKWNRTIMRPEHIPEMIRKAFKIAKSEKKGATHLELPEDIAASNVAKLSPIKIKKGFNIPAPPIESIKEAANLIKKSSHPIILIGNGVIRADASKELVKFAEKSKIFVANTFMSKGVISSKHHLSIGSIGLQSKDYISCGFDHSDLVITVGYDIVEYAPEYWNPDGNKRILNIDSKFSDVNQYFQTALDLTGDIKETLTLLTNLVLPKKLLKHVNNLRKLHNEEFLEHKNDASIPMKPQKILYDIRKEMKDDDILISDVGAHKMWIARLFPAYQPNTVIISNGFASMGIAVPGAIAAKILYPKKNIVSVNGDGGLLMNIQELETAKRLGLSFVIVVFSDQTYGLIEWKQHNKYKKTNGIYFTNPDFVKLAESFGGKAYIVKKSRDFPKMLKKAFNDKKHFTIIEVPVDKKENFKLTKKLEKNVCLV